MIQGNPSQLVVDRVKERSRGFGGFGFLINKSFWSTTFSRMWLLRKSVSCSVYFSKAQTLQLTSCSSLQLACLNTSGAEYNFLFYVSKYTYYLQQLYYQGLDDESQFSKYVYLFIKCVDNQTRKLNNLGRSHLACLVLAYEKGLALGCHCGSSVCDCCALLVWRCGRRNSCNMLEYRVLYCRVYRTSSGDWIRIGGGEHPPRNTWKGYGEVSTFSGSW